jgi:hypothetical protein
VVETDAVQRDRVMAINRKSVFRVPVLLRGVNRRTEASLKGGAPRASRDA